jgi:magnesium chelatase subunit D
MIGSPRSSWGREAVDATERVATILACSALDPGLAGLLLLDLDPALVHPLASWLAGLLGGESRVIPIGPKMAEDTLWERLKLDRDRAEHPEGPGFRWAPGPLVGEERDGEDRPPGVVAVPDLALAGLPVARAAVTLIGADVAHLERSGMARRWRPRDRWLAALRKEDVARVSPHLLDRFSVRIDAGDLQLPRDGALILPDADPVWSRAVTATREEAEPPGQQEDELPVLTVAAADRIVALVPLRSPGVRRDLALGRLARALAALAGEAEVLPGHVDRAAELIGLAAAAGPPASSWDGSGRPAGPEFRRISTYPVAMKAGPGADPENGSEGGTTGGPVAARPDRMNGVNGHLVAIGGGEPATLPPGPAGDVSGPPRSTAHTPYPEDDAKSVRDVASLRIGWQRALTGPPHGQPIGTQRTLDRRDIAVAATLLNAARYQTLRCPAHYREDHRLHVRKADLLSYRRAPQPGHLLVLVLDHTCRIRDWDWYQPLAPYLRWAYVTRALVGVVEMGAAGKDVRSELRATQFRSRSVLDPRVVSALERPPGRATPLAHGLTLAAGMLRHDTQQASALVGEAFLVVVTDGRANVPLADSHAATWPPAAVGGSAVDDAVQVGSEISKLRRVRCVVIDPGPRPYRHLTARLAVALAAPLVNGSPLRSQPHPPGLAGGAT